MKLIKSMKMQKFLVVLLPLIALAMVACDGDPNEGDTNITVTFDANGGLFTDGLTIKTATPNAGGGGDGHVTLKPDMG